MTEYMSLFPADGFEGNRLPVMKAFWNGLILIRYRIWNLGEEEIRYFKTDSERKGSVFLAETRL